MTSRIDKDYSSQYHMLEEESYTIQAVVVSDVTHKDYKDVYEIEVKEINGDTIDQDVKNGDTIHNDAKDRNVKNRDTKYAGRKWLLNVKRSKIGNSDSKLKFGNLIEFNGTIEIPSTARNYMGFDYQKYLKSRKVYGTITLEDKLEVVQENHASIMDNIWHEVRNCIKKTVQELLPKEIRGLCIGILIGDREEISDDMKDDFQESNLTHMLAVSGAHISYIILGLTILLKKARYRFSHIFMIIFLLFFMGLTNFTPSVQRASLMAILTLIGGLIYRKSDVYTNLALSSLIILFNNPYAILDIGFQLSYGGTIGIVMLYPKILNCVRLKLVSKNIEIGNKNIHMKNGNENLGFKNLFQRIFFYVLEAICVTVSANIIIIPIMAFSFHKVSLTFWISNLMAGPLLGSIIILGFIVCSISLICIPVASFISIPLKELLYLLAKIAELCSSIPFSSIIVRTPYLLEIFLYYCFVFLLLYFPAPKKNICKKRIIIFLTIVAVVVLPISIIINQNYQSLNIYFVDVGQGDCTFIRTPKNQTILIDGGGSETGSFDVGEQILLPYLLNRKIKKIDYMMISHFDSDHCQGCIFIVERLKVKNVIIGKQFESSSNYRKFAEIVKEKNIKVYVVEAGNRVNIEKNLYFDILWPDSKNLINDNVLNNNSLVCKLVYENFKVLFTGDIEEKAERAIVEKYKDNVNILNATVLKIAHHGSKTSSTKKFLEVVNPKIALIGVGEKNTFGHPSNITLENLKEIKCKIYRTDECGEIVVKLNKKRKD